MQCEWPGCSNTGSNSRLIDLPRDHRGGLIPPRRSLTVCEVHIDMPIPERFDREGDSQPLPTINDSQSIQERVIEDIEERMKVGLQRYGTLLQAGNGRRALVDAYEEALDLAMYLKQRIVEEDLGL